MISNFGITINKMRKNKGLSLKDVAERGGLSHSYLSQIENGKRNAPKPEMIKKLSKGLDVPYIQLMTIAGYVNDKGTVQTDSLIEAFGGKPSDRSIEKVYLDSILNNKSISIYYKDKLMTKEERENVNQLIDIHLKGR